MGTIESNQNEKMFYDDNSVLVTQSRFVVRGKTYAMRNISSVTIQRVAKSNSALIFFIVVGFISLMFGETGVIVGIILIALGILIYTSSKDDFVVQISSNSGESKALMSKNREYIQTIVDSVNEAIIFRG